MTPDLMGAVAPVEPPAEGIRTPRIEDLPREDRARIWDRRIEFERAIRTSPESVSTRDWLAGFEGHSREVLLRQLFDDYLDFHSPRDGDERAREFLSLMGDRDRAVVETVVSARTGTRPEAGAGAVPASSGDPNLPQLRRYDIYEFRSRGGAAAVYRGYDRQARRIVALKFPHRERWEPPAEVAQFWGEVRLQIELHGSAVPVVFDCGTADNGQPYLAMELVEGQTLEQWRRDPATPPGFEPRVRVLHQICQAVAPTHWHSLRICHFDLSPKNIFVTPNGRIVILDWGLGRALRASGAAVLVGGTPGTMAPEQARAMLGLEVAAFDPRTDVFALGCRLFEDLTGRQLIDGIPAEEIVGWTAAGDFAGPLEWLWGAVAAGEVPRRLAEITKLCLAPDPSDPSGRPADAGELARLLSDHFDAAETERREAEVRAERDRHELKARIERERQERRERATREHSRRLWRCAAAVLVLIAGLSVGAVGRYQAAELAAKADQGIKEGDASLDAGQVQKARLIWQQTLNGPGLNDRRRFELRLRLVKAATFLGDHEYARAELDSLGKHPLAGQYKGPLDFEKAMQSLQKSMEFAARPGNLASDLNPDEVEALALLKAVADDPSVPEADRATARGLRAHSADDAIRHYREALERKGFHPYAGPHLLVTQLLAGRLDDALARASAWAEAAPDDPLPWFYKTLTLALQNKLDKAAGELPRFRRATGGGRTLPLDVLRAGEAGVAAVGVLNDHLGQTMVAETREELEKSQAAFLADLSKAVPGNLNVVNSAMFAVPMSPNQRRAFGRLIAAAQMSNSLWRAEHEAGLREIEGTDNFVARGAVEFVRCLLLAKTGRPVEAGVALRRSVDSPHQLWDARAGCLVCLSKLELSKARTAWFVGEVYRAEARRYLREAARIPALPELIRRKCLTFAAEAGGSEFVTEIARELDAGRP